MRLSARTGFSLAAIVAMIAVIAGAAHAQADPNALPNPYLTIDNWAKMPEGRTWGQTSQLSLDRDGNVSAPALASASASLTIRGLLATCPLVTRQILRPRRLAGITARGAAPIAS